MTDRRELSDSTRAMIRACAWVLALGVPIVLAVTAAAVVIAWALIPTEYTATVWLRIAGPQPDLVGNAGNGNNALADRRTQAALIRSNFVLNAALRKPGIAQLPSIRDRRDPVAWLRDQLTVGFPGDSEILQITLSGDDPSQIVKLLNAVKDAYMEEVVAVEHETERRQKEILEQMYRRMLEQLAKKASQIEKMQTSGPEATPNKTKKPGAADDLSTALEVMRIEMDGLKNMADNLGDRLQQAEIELAAPPRVTLIEAASVPRSADFHKKLRLMIVAGVAAFLAAVVILAAVVFIVIVRFMLRGRVRPQ